MNRLKLKETMDQIHMKEEMQKEIIMKVKRQTDRRAFGKKRLHQAAAAAAAFVLIAGAVIPSQAAIRYFVKDRLENIPKQELEAVNQMVQGQNNAEADSFSREYSKEEIKRMQQMQEAYQNGRFPQQTITFTDSVGQIPDDSLSYDPDTGFLYLPDRTLTDEELLQAYNSTEGLCCFSGNSRAGSEKGVGGERRRSESKGAERRLDYRKRSTAGSRSIFADGVWSVGRRDDSRCIFG